MDVRKRKRPAVGLAITEQTSEDDDEDSGYHRVSNEAKIFTCSRKKYLFTVSR